MRGIGTRVRSGSGARGQVVAGLFLACACALVAACDSGTEPMNGPQAGTGAAPLGGMGGAAPLAGTGGAPLGGTGGAGMAGGGTGGAGLAGAGMGGAGMAGAGMGGAAGAPMAGSAGGMAATGEPTFSAIFSEILTVGSVGNCMFGACHGGPPEPELNGNLRIAYDDKEGAYQNLVGFVSTSTLCAGMTLVVPGDSQASLLIQKFGENPPCGMRMPIGAPLSEAHVAQIAAWIDNGALND